MRTSMISCVTLLLAIAGDAAGVCHATPAEQGTIAHSAAVARLPGTQTLRGIVDSVDQGRDIIKIRLSPTATEQFKVQDGLIFNAVRFGDPVEVLVQDIAGFKTIVGLSQQ